MHRVVAHRVAAQQQGRGEEGAAFAAFAHRLESIAGAEHDFVTLGQHGDALGDVALLVHRRWSAHPHAFDLRGADHDFRQAVAHPLGHRIDARFG